MMHNSECLRQHRTRPSWIYLLGFSLLTAIPLFARPASAETQPYLEPGTLRLSHTLSLEGIFHSLPSGERVDSDGRDKTFSQDPNQSRVWKTDWGTNLLTEVAARPTKDISARVLFDAQGSYADRYFRPLNVNHDMDLDNAIFQLRQAEAQINRKNWYLKGFHGASHNGWTDKGDVFNFYPGVYPQRDYLGSSGYFGVYPPHWQQDQYLNISGDLTPSGGELGGMAGQWDGAVAYGNQPFWGYRNSGYARLRRDLGKSQLNFFARNEDAPYSFDPAEDERKESYALTWTRPSPDALAIESGIIYQPFRVGQTYEVARDADGGTGIQGSSWNTGTKTVQREDGLGGKLKLDGYLPIKDSVINTLLQAEYLGVVAGNKEQVDLELGTDFGSRFRGAIKVGYRRPVEGPMPFLYEGTPDNIGAVVSAPRGPDSPFTVDWTNREASFITATFWFDKTPGSRMFLYDPHTISGWNLNPEEDGELAVALQVQMTDYKTATDRQHYYDENGNVVWEPASHAGAWATERPLNELKLLGHGKLNNKTMWTLGLAAGETPAILGIAYSTTTATTKSITRYYSLEGRLEREKWATWAHYGTGVWGPEENIHPYFGDAYDRIFGGGVSYNITRHTSWDISYLGARQKSNEFNPSGLGEFDEIRTVFSHRFGFVFEFEPPLRPGTRVE